MRTGLSSYYIKLRDIGYSLNEMMERVSTLENIVGYERLGDTDLKSNALSINDKWKKLEQFLAYEYRAHHLKISDFCQNHCCTFALNKNLNDRV